MGRGVRTWIRCFVTSPALSIPLLAVKVTTSSMENSHSVTGGMYKAPETNSPPYD
ncbi:hypothetical protein QJS10_CPB11g02156 [Acorus calamus]|uniref:Uncharacterized protein n=1 Tax=Acorus calamus TaxID=4465 RepID=A0AAV9DWH3_ACOCL|nr:hypothetical protein QJS10_CPB11g02156 [Acorus calamus]